MARIRSIKPEYWSDERMATVGLEARLLFIGLLNLADDEGRMRGHPALVRGALFPYDDLTNAQVAGWLEELEDAGRIQRYQADGESYVWVRNFGKHQKIDHPSASKLPTPPSESSESPRELSRALASPREKSPRSREQGAGIGAGSREETSSPPPAAAEGAADALVAFWNEKAHPKLARVRGMTSNRKTALRARLKEHRLEELQEAIQRLGASSFCLGAGTQGWTADLDWLLRPGSVAKVLEGKYDDRGTGPVVARPCVQDGCAAASVREVAGLAVCEAHATEHEAFWRREAG